MKYSPPGSSMGNSQEYRSGLPCPLPGDLPDPSTEPASLMSPVLAGRFFTSSAPWQALAASYWLGLGHVTIPKPIAVARGMHCADGLRPNFQLTCSLLKVSMGWTYQGHMDWVWEGVVSQRNTGMGVGLPVPSEVDSKEQNTDITPELTKNFELPDLKPDWEKWYDASVLSFLEHIFRSVTSLSQSISDLWSLNCYLSPSGLYTYLVISPRGNQQRKKPNFTQSR